MEHSEATLALLESTKGVVQNKVASMTTAPSTDPDELRATVDAMLGDYMSGFNKAGDDLFGRFDAIVEAEEKEKEKVAKKKQAEKDKKKMKKIKWTPEEEEEEPDEFLDAGEVDEDSDSDWEDGGAKGKSKPAGTKKPKAPKSSAQAFDTSIIEEDVEQMLDEGDFEPALTEAQIKSMKVSSWVKRPQRRRSEASAEKARPSATKEGVAAAAAAALPLREGQHAVGRTCAHFLSRPPPMQLRRSPS
jgi:hypothetical protein